MLEYVNAVGSTDEEKGYDNMLAALHDGKGTMHVKEIAKPAVGPGSAIIRVRASGICGSDLLNYGNNVTPETFPGGHEVAGEIVEVGEGADPSRVGRRVAVESVGLGRACLDCWFCRIGQYRQCLRLGPLESGGFAEYLKRPDIACFPLPDNLSWEEGALVEPLAVSVHGVRRGQLIGGETVAVLGAGNIGLTAVAAARALGAGKVLVTARHEQQAAMAKRLGADDALPPDGPALQEALADVTDGRGADLTIETVGGRSDATVKQALAVTRMQGRIVILGGFHVPVTLDWLQPLLKEQSIIFSACYSVMNGRHDYEVAIELLASGRVELEQIVTHRFPLEKIQHAFETAYEKSSGSIKVQIQM
jgi:2-desacetyl-2-hydroxyethyl bacteriochlorophyllide A dehydrogenase